MNNVALLQPFLHLFMDVLFYFGNQYNQCGCAVCR